MFINEIFGIIGGDMATTRRYLEMASKATSSGLDNNGNPITLININCLDPLGRSALLIGF